jgi:hypothetical protein
MPASNKVKFSYLNANLMVPKIPPVNLNWRSALYARRSRPRPLCRQLNDDIAGSVAVFHGGAFRIDARYDHALPAGARHLNRTSQAQPKMRRAVIRLRLLVAGIGLLLVA